MRIGPSFKSFLTVLAVIGFSAYGASSDAQNPGAYYTPPETAAAPDTSPPIVVPPAAPANHFSFTDKDDVFTMMSKEGDAVSATIHDLNANLAFMRDLNTEGNQKLLNEFGSAYNAPDLGTHFHDAITGINISQTAQDLNKLSENITSDLKSPRTSFDDLKKQGSDIQAMIQQMSQLNKGHLPKSASDLTDDQKAQIFTDSRKAELKSLGAFTEGFTESGQHFMDFVQFNYQLEILSANIASISNTYNNLLAISGQRPSAQIGINDLNHKLLSVDGLATGQLKSLSNLDSAVARINEDFAQYQQAQATMLSADSDALDTKTYEAPMKIREAVNTDITELGTQLTSSNSQMTPVLGIPPRNANTISTGDVIIDPSIAAMMGNTQVGGAAVTAPNTEAAAPAPPDLEVKKGIPQ